MLPFSPRAQVPYTIVNAPSPEHAERSFRGEYFEIYSVNLTTRYGDVFWKPHDIDLPPEIVERFRGKVRRALGR